ncbi:CST, telomere maintenance, complex subunit CTC1-domain-containing protein, partial [Umbelopsis sp. PMI_123]
MNAISIAELAASDLRQPTDSQSQGTCLTGEFEYCEYTTDPTRDYECLMLIDPDTFTGIKCRTTAFDRSLIGLPVIVQVWCLQYYEEPLLIVSITDCVTQETSEPVLTVIDNARLQRADNWITSTLTFHKLSTVQGNEASFNLISVVVAKSPMYLDDDKEPYFIVQLAQDDVATFITFKGKNIRMHHSEIELENYYLFKCVEQAVDSSNSQPMLLFDGTSADLCKLTLQEVNKMRDNISRPDPPSAPPVFLQPHDSSRDQNFMGGYSGVVTRVIDQILGLYVLDEKWLLALTQYPAYNALASYLEGSKITVRRAHLLSFHTNAFGSSFLSRYCQCDPAMTSEQHTWLTLVACTHTSITIEALPTSIPPNDHVVTSSSTVEAFIANNGFVYQHGYLDMAIWLEAYLSLLRKAKDINFSSIIEFTNALLESTGQQLGEQKPRDLYQEFIHHTTHCLLCECEPHTDDINLPRLHLQNYPTISQLTSQLCSIPNLIEVPIASSVHNVNPLTNITIQAKTYQLSNSKPFLCALVGYISGGVDGRMYFADATGRLPIILTNVKPHELLKNNLYIITNCAFLTEDLGYVDASGTSADCSCQYLLAKWDDIVPLQPKSQIVTFCTSIPANITYNRVFAYDPVPSLSHILQSKSKVIHIEHIQAPYVTFNDYGKLYLLCHIDVTLFDLVPSTEASTHILEEPPVRCRFSLSSASKTLAFLSYIKVNGWYVVQTDLDELKPSASVVELAPSASIYPILPSHGRFKLDQYVLHNHLISPIGSSPMETTIRSVKDILNINFAVESEPDSPAILSNGFYKKLVSFEGYVVIKEFTESRIRTSGLDRYTRQVYDRLGVGTGKPNRWLYMRIRCIDTPDTIDVYYDVSKTLYPLGLVPGCKVQFLKVSLKVSDRTKSVYAVVVPPTWIQIVETEVGTKLKGTANIEHDVESRKLISFLQTADSRIYKTVCTVRSLQQVNICWICLECGQRIIKNICFGTCTKEKRLFLADAIFTVTDGTADITVSAIGEDMVMTLLRLSPTEISNLKEVAWMHGELSYSNWFTKADTIRQQQAASPVRTLQSICTNAKIFGSLCLCVKRVLRYKNNAGDTGGLLEKLNVVPIKLSSDGVQSLTFSRIRLEALKLEAVNTIAEATSLL